MNSDEWPWSDKQKREFVWNSLVRQAQDQESNSFYFTLHTVQDEGDFEPIFLSKSEQRTIIKDFQADGMVQINESEEPHTVYVGLIDTNKPRESQYSQSILNLADLMKDVDLRNQVRDLLLLHFNVCDIREIKSSQSTKVEVLEEKDELLLLMEELGFVEIDWESLKHQPHRVIGNRYMKVKFFGGKAKQFADSLCGRTTVIRAKALEQVAWIIKDRMTHHDLNDLFIQAGVPYSLVMGNQSSKRETVYNIFLTLSSTGEKNDIDLLYKLLEEFAHPLVFGGDTKSSVDFQYKVTKVIRYDGLSLLGGKVHEFNDSDTAKMEELESQEHELSDELVHTLFNVFGGNPFGQPPKKNHKKEQESNSMQDQGSQTHIHIYNDNKAVQTVNLSDISKQNTNNTKPIKHLKDAEINFDDDTAKIKIGSQFVALPPEKNQHWFCRAMFERQIGEAIDWSIIYQEMLGSEPTDTTKNKRSVQDAMYAVNNKIKEVVNCDEDLFIWRDKTIARQY